MRNAITLPAALAHGLVLNGLTAPAMRMALVLIAAAGSRTGDIDVLKPRLEEYAGVRLDNAHRSLERLRECTIVAGGQPAHLFDELIYTPGEQKRLAGVVTGSLSGAARSAIGQPQFAGRTLTISLDELRRLSTVPGILLLLRFAADRENGDVRVRMDEIECGRIFGDYLSRATIERQNTAGESIRWTALSRIYAELVEPGIKDLWGALDGHIVDSVPGVPKNRGHGNAWSHIDVTLKKLAPRKSMRELAELGKAHEEYQIRKRQSKVSRGEDTPR